MTNRTINDLGERLRIDKIENANSNDLNLLQDFRLSHKDDMASVFHILCQISKKVERDAIVTYRLKRIETIINKLVRMPKTQLKRMGDIAGCRVIFNDEKSVNRLWDKLKEVDDVSIKKSKNWIENPQNDGYQSLHLYVTFKKSSTRIEIQIRYQEIHNWATLVEISDLLYNSGLKEYKNNPQNIELSELHKILSVSSGELNFKQKQYIFFVVKKQDYIRELFRVFSQNYIAVRKKWITLKDSPKNKYFLIEATKYEVPKIDSFLTFLDAELEYFNRYTQKNKNKSNLVLTHLVKPDYKRISIAYSNYILTYHNFINQFFEILSDLIGSTLKNKKYRLFYIYYRYYTLIVNEEFISILDQIFKVSDTEFIYVKRGKLLIDHKKYKGKKRLKLRTQEWLQDINAQLQLRSEQNSKIFKLVSEHEPVGRFTKIYYEKRIAIIQRRLNRRIKTSIKNLEKNRK